MGGYQEGFVDFAEGYCLREFFGGGSEEVGDDGFWGLLEGVCYGAVDIRVVVDFTVVVVLTVVFVVVILPCVLFVGGGEMGGSGDLRLEDIVLTDAREMWWSVDGRRRRRPLGKRKGTSMLTMLLWLS